MFKLKELEAISFRSYKHLYLENIDSQGLVLISGENGSGKSSVRMAIEYLLTDTISDDISVDELTYNKEGNCSIRGVIENGGDVITIKKYREHHREGNRTILLVNGEDLSTTDRRETQKKIENLLGINNKMLCVSTIFSSKSHSFPEARDAERKDIIYDAKGLHKYAEYYNTTRTKEAKLLKDINELEIKHKVLLEEEKRYESEVRDLEERVFNYEMEREERINDVKSKEFPDVEELKKNIEELKEGIEEEISSVEVEKLADKRMKLSIDRTTVEIEAKNKQRELEGIIEKTCPVLGIFCSILEDRLSSDNDGLRKEIKDLRNKALELGKEVRKVTDLEELMKSGIKANNFLLTEIKKIEYDIEHIESEEKKREEIIQQLKETPNPYEELLESAIRIAEDKDEKLVEIEDRLKECREEVKYYKFWKEGYGKTGIPNMKSEDFLEGVEIETNKILAELSDNISVVLDSRTTKKRGKSFIEKIKYNVKHPDKAVENYNSYSGGQKQRICVADKFAFNSLLSKFGFIFLDEVLEGSMDLKGKEAIISFLRRKADEIGSIFVVSHDPDIKDKFDNVLNVYMRAGESVIQ